MQKKSASRTIKVIAWVLFILLFVVTAIVSAFSLKTYLDRQMGNEPELFGYNIASVADSAMEPQISKGDAVFYTPTTNSSFLKVQEVLLIDTLDEGAKRPVRRIIDAVYQNNMFAYTVKGDAQTEVDVIAIEAVHGKVAFSVPFVGSLIDLTSTHKGLVISVLVPLAFILFIEIIFIIIYAILKKKERGLVLSQNLPDDEDENFVDVTAQYLNDKTPKPQSFLAVDNTSTEKFSNLDFNPLKNRAKEPQQEIESVTINTSRAEIKPVYKKLSMFVDGAEMAQMSLQDGQTFKIKIGGYTVKIDVEK